MNHQDFAVSVRSTYTHTYMHNERPRTLKSAVPKHERGAPAAPSRGQDRHREMRRQATKQTNETQQTSQQKQQNQRGICPIQRLSSIRPSVPSPLFLPSRNQTLASQRTASSLIRRRRVVTLRPRLSIRRPSASGYGCGATRPSDSCYGAYAHAVPHGDNAWYAACARPSHRRNTHSGYPRG